MKKTTTIGVILLLILAVFLLAYNRGHKNDEIVSEEPQAMCFLRELDTQAGKDYSYVQATLAEDGTVTGVFNLVPAEKDSLKGPFTGTWQTANGVTMLDVIHSYSAEGMQADEARKIKITDAGASVGFGEVIEDNDVYVYKDESKITYGDVMPKIACDMVPLGAR